MREKPKITDWIQAMAAIIAIPAAIVAFVTFFQKDLQLQHQISDLDTITKQSIKQTELLIEQLEILKEEVKLQKSRVEKERTNRIADIDRS